MMMGEHLPKPLQRFRRNPEPELWNVALQIGANELLPPAERDALRGREKAVGKSAPNPQPEELGSSHLGKLERSQFHMGDASRQRLARLPKQQG